MNANQPSLIEITNASAVSILLVEDNEADVLLTKKAFEKAKIANTITVVSDGEMALDFLKNRGIYKNVARPDIILLDINLPKINGKQVLKEIKEDKKLRSIPVVILSGSKSEQDILRSYDLQANGYIVKPMNKAKFHDAVDAIENFWFSVVVLPSDL